MDQRTETGSRAWDRLGDLISWLAARSSLALFGGFLAWFVLWSVLFGAFMDWIVHERHHDAVAAVAGPLMPAIGTLFAFLTAFVITNQWNRTRDADRMVGEEADAAVRLALATQTPCFESTGIRRLQADYLEAVLASEWDTLRTSMRGDEEAASRLQALQRAVRAVAARSDLPQAAAYDLMVAAEGVAVTRRDRLHLGGHGLPAPLFLLVLVSAVALSINAIALNLQLEGWFSLLIGGLIVTIALDVALLVAISTPFEGPLRVVPLPLSQILGELEGGAFGPLAERAAPAP